MFMKFAALAAVLALGAGGLGAPAALASPGPDVTTGGPAFSYSISSPIGSSQQELPVTLTFTETPAAHVNDYMLTLPQAGNWVRWQWVDPSTGSAVYDTGQVPIGRASETFTVTKDNGNTVSASEVIIPASYAPLPAYCPGPTLEQVMTVHISGTLANAKTGATHPVEDDFTSTLDTPVPGYCAGQAAASPDNNQATAVPLGTLISVGQVLTATGDNTAGTSAWYSVTVPSFLSLVNISVTGGSGDEATLYDPAAGAEGPSTDMNESIYPGTAYIEVTGGTAGKPFTLTITVTTV